MSETQDDWLPSEDNPWYTPVYNESECERIFCKRKKEKYIKIDKCLRISIKVQRYCYNHLKKTCCKYKDCISRKKNLIYNNLFCEFHYNFIIHEYIKEKEIYHLYRYVEKDEYIDSLFNVCQSKYCKNLSRERFCMFHYNIWKISINNYHISQSELWTDHIVHYIHNKYLLNFKYDTVRKIISNYDFNIKCLIELELRNFHIDKYKEVMDYGHFRFHDFLKLNSEYDEYVHYKNDFWLDFTWNSLFNYTKNLKISFYI